MELKPEEIKRSIYNLLPLLGLTLFLFIGIIVHKDYGLGWDEWAQMTERGEVNYNFVTTLDEEALLNSPGIYQGPAFDLFLVSFQRALNITDSREVYFFRHLISFIFFWLSGLAFYFILRKKYTDPFIIFIGICWYFLMPRIFADSFGNSKDIPFLSMTVISLLSLMNFLEKPSWKTGILHGFFCGFMIDIRLMGVLMPAITAFMLFLRVILADQKSRTALSYAIPVGLLVLSTIAFTILFWPVLWLDPLHHFVKGWNEMSVFNFSTTTLFQEQYIYTDQLPWYYDAVWMGMTIPLQYIFFFAAGVLFLIFNIISFKKDRITIFELEIASLLVFFLPLLVIILLNSCEYDGWRHLFYLYAPFCIIAMRGLHEIQNLLVKYVRMGWINLALLAITLPVAYTMVETHPYQNIYFNRIAGPNAQSAKFKYEMDYWGLAFREALEKLYFTKSTDERILIYAMNPPAQLSVEILPKNIRHKFIFTTKEKANYFIHDYRWDPSEHNDLNRIDSIKVDGAVISSTYHLRDAEIRQVGLQTMNGKYIYVDKSSVRPVLAHDQAPEVETFSMVCISDNNYAVYTSENKYLSAELMQQSEITATREKIATWELFTVSELDSNRIALKAANGKYLTVDEKTLQLFARADSIGKNEVFEIIPSVKK